MPNSVYKVIELVGSSPESWEKAVAAAVKQASSTLRELRIAEVIQQDAHIAKDGSIESYRARFESHSSYWKGIRADPLSRAGTGSARSGAGLFPSRFCPCPVD